MCYDYTRVSGLTVKFTGELEAEAAPRSIPSQRHAHESNWQANWQEILCEEARSHQCLETDSDRIGNYPIESSARSRFV